MEENEEKSEKTRIEKNNKEIRKTEKAKNMKTGYKNNKREDRETRGDEKDTGTQYLTKAHTQTHTKVSSHLQDVGPRLQLMLLVPAKQ